MLPRILINFYSDPKRSHRTMANSTHSKENNAIAGYIKKLVLVKATNYELFSSSGNAVVEYRASEEQMGRKRKISEKSFRQQVDVQLGTCD